MLGINDTPAHLGVITGTSGGRWHGWGWVIRAGMQPWPLGDVSSALSAKLGGFPSFCLKHREAKESNGGRELDAGLWIPWEPREHSPASSWGQTAFIGGSPFAPRPILCDPGEGGFLLNSSSLHSPCPSLFPRGKAQQIGNYYFLITIAPPFKSIHCTKAISICGSLP